MLSRYKFVAKMLDGYERVLEVGCGDGFGARIVRPAVGRLTCIDIDPLMIESAIKNQGGFDIQFKCTKVLENADAIYMLDVLEHSPEHEEAGILRELSIRAPLVIIGIPSLEFQPYASKLSRANHVNCKSGPDLKLSMKQHFRHVLMFSMTDEVVSTGFHKMAAYIFAIGVN